MNIIELAKEAGFEVVNGELKLYFNGDKVILRPNCVGTVVDGLKSFATLVRSERRPTTEKVWCDLTDDEIDDAYTSDAHENTPKSFARAVIAKFKEKNK